MAYTQSGSAPASFKFNSFEEIKSHSSILYNERLAILFYLLDMNSIEMNTNFDIGSMQKTRAILKQVYKNIRMLIRYNPTCRSTLNLDTKDEGTYIPDVALSAVDRMIEHCEVNGYTMKKLYIIVQEINRIETLIKDILQYFSYFIRPDFRQKPDLEIATQQYQELADSRTVDELRALVGKSSLIDFEGLGSSRIELQEAIEEEPTITEFDKNLDGEENESARDENESTHN